MIVYPSQNLDGEESNNHSNYFDISSENLSNGVISKMILTHILKGWDESKTQLHPSFSSMTPLEQMFLKNFPLF